MDGQESAGRRNGDKRIVPDVLGVGGRLGVNEEEGLQRELKFLQLYKIEGIFYEPQKIHRTFQSHVQGFARGQRVVGMSWRWQ